MLIRTRFSRCVLLTVSMPSCVCPSAGDHLTLLNVFKAYCEAGRSASNWAYHNYVNERALKQAASVRQQLAKLMEKSVAPCVLSASCMMQKHTEWC